MQRRRIEPRQAVPVGGWTALVPGSNVGHEMPPGSCASTVPLVTVIPFKDLRLTGGRLPLTPAEKEKTREAEEAFGLPPSRYFYAGRAHPDFGDCALVYKPSIESGRTGSVSPFDTGGVYWGYIHPFCGPDEADRRDRARALVAQTSVDLGVWRADFDAFLAAAFEAPSGYFDAPPSQQSPWGPGDLPAWDPRNHANPTREWRAWTWEVRLYQEHAVELHLEGWGCLEAVQKLLDEALTSGAVSPFDRTSAWLEQLQSMNPVVGTSFCDDINAAVRARYV